MNKPACFVSCSFLLSFFVSANISAFETVDSVTLYQTHCGTCHQADGGGVPFMQPALIGSPRANNAPGGVIEMILKGSAAVPIGASQYQNEMPGFVELSNEEIAAIANYVRSNFTNNGSRVSADDVQRARGGG